MQDKDNSYDKYYTYRNNKIGDNSKNNNSYLNKTNLTEYQHEKKINNIYKKKSTDKKNSKDSGKSGSIPGVRMYNQYIEHIKKREEKIKKIKDEEEKREIKELKFKPDINKSTINYSPGRIEDKLIAYGNKYKQKRFNKKKENLFEEEHRPQLTKETEILGKIKRKNRKDNLQNHIILINPDYLVEPIRKENINKMMTETNTNSNKGFISKNDNLKNNYRSKSTDNIKNKYYKTYYNPLHPVTRKTTKILGRKIPLPKLTPDKNLYDYLYIEGKLLKEKRDLERMKFLEKQYPFKPKLSKSTDKTKNTIISKKNVFDRLYTAQNLQERNNKTPDKNLKDSKNGQLLFKPKITRGPLNPKQRELSYNNDINNNNKRNEELENKKKEEIRNKYFKKMNKIITEAKKMKYIELFNRLDSDNDGLISYKKIKLSTLDNKKLIALTPILQELQYNGVEMNVNTFCQKIDNIQEIKNIMENELNEIN